MSLKRRITGRVGACEHQHDMVEALKMMNLKTIKTLKVTL